MLSVLYKGGLLMGSAHMTVGELSSFLMYAFWVGLSIGGISHGQALSVHIENQAPLDGRSQCACHSLSKNEVLGVGERVPGWVRALGVLPELRTMGKLCFPAFPCYGMCLPEPRGEESGWRERMETLSVLSENYTSHIVLPRVLNSPYLVSPSSPFLRISNAFLSFYFVL